MVIEESYNSHLSNMISLKDNDNYLYCYNALGENYKYKITIPKNLISQFTVYWNGSLYSDDDIEKLKVIYNDIIHASNKQKKRIW